MCCLSFYILVTEGTHCSVRCKGLITVLSTTTSATLVATATEFGKVQVWQTGNSLYIHVRLAQVMM